MLDGAGGNLDSDVTYIQVDPATGGDAIIIDDEPWFLRAEFVREGSDLRLIGPDGEELLIQGYFRLENPPEIRTPDGVVLSGELVTRLAGPLAPGQYAQAAPGVAGEPIGRIETATGEVTVTRLDGTQATLSQGDPVFQGDIVETGAEGAVGIVFADESTFSLAEDGRMTLDEMIYDPGGQQGNMSISLLQGAFTFVSGEIAKTGVDAMKIGTPTATIGIRGSAGGGNTDTAGVTTVVVMPEAGGLVGEFTIQTATGVVTLNIPLSAVNIASANLPPSQPPPKPRLPPPRPPRRKPRPPPRKLKRPSNRRKRRSPPRPRPKPRPRSPRQPPRLLSPKLPSPKRLPRSPRPRPSSSKPVLSAPSPRPPVPPGSRFRAPSS